jgi:hypothetical protein
MNSKSYLKIIFLFVIFLLVVTALINYIVDPGNIYTKYSSNKNKLTPAVYIKKLLESNYGLLMPKNTWNERDLKKTLAEYPINYDCAIIGSSRIQQISSNRQNKSLVGTCSDMKNLSVPGATLEDYLAMSNVILKNTEFMPRTIVFGIDPWSFNFGRDKRWVRYEQDYLEMKSTLFKRHPSTHLNNNSNKDLLINLFNFQYLKRSLSVLFKTDILIVPAPEFNHSKGLDFDVMLKDGSRIFNGLYINKTKNSINTVSENDAHSKYKIIANSFSQDEAIKIFKKLVRHLKISKINIVFVLTPYHHSVWNYPSQSIVRSIELIEKKVHEIAEQYKARVIGSYNPINIGCLENEFYDSIHPMDTCLIKLESNMTVH